MYSCHVAAIGGVCACITFHDESCGSLHMIECKSFLQKKENALTV